MLRRLSLRDVAIVAELELELGSGFTVLTGETGAGKSILVDALQLALGNRADAALVREGAARSEVSAEFDVPPALLEWLEAAGFSDGADDGLLLLKRSVDAQGKSRAWINGSPSTVAQLREVAEHLVDIHGQHAWQSLTRPAAVRTLLDAEAGADTAALTAAWSNWRGAVQQLQQAQSKTETWQRESDRLAWQIAELEKLAPVEGEWPAIDAEHQRLAHGQALVDGVRAALAALTEQDDSADTLVARASHALADVERFDATLGGVLEVLKSAEAQLEDAAHSLSNYLRHADPDPARLAALDERMGAWMAMARRWRRTPDELPALLHSWKAELAQLQASADIEALQRDAANAERVWRTEAERISRLRHAAAPAMAAAVTQAMQQLGMAGGRFEVALLPLAEPQAQGLESVELRVAGHAGSTPRPLAKVASGGELSRLALAIAVTTAADAADAAPTLIFDEIDAGVGGTVADSVGRLMKQLGRTSQVLAVTHLAQVAACADGHFVVTKRLNGKETLSHMAPVEGVARVAEIARMLGGESLSGTAHAQALLGTTAGTAK